MNRIKYRQTVSEKDIKIIKKIVESSGFFFPFEVQIAIEMFKEKLLYQGKSDYDYLFIEKNDIPVGFTCFGKDTMTKDSWYLYWIAVYNDCRNQGFGKELLKRTEYIAIKNGGKSIYIDTSGKEQYKSTNKFYNKCGYKKVARIKNYFAQKDDKLIYYKKLINQKFRI